MRFVIITGNPKQDGLCKSVETAVIRGAEQGGADVAIIDTGDMGRCRVCGTGWGICRSEHLCKYGDDGFADAQAVLAAADAVCLVSPVYWGEVSESLKSFIDRLRRCHFGAQGILAGKPALIVTSPGGTGNGMMTAQEQLDRFCRHMGADIFDYIGVNRWNRDYMEIAAHSAAKAIAQGRKQGETI